MPALPCVAGAFLLHGKQDVWPLLTGAERPAREGADLIICATSGLVIGFIVGLTSSRHKRCKINGNGLKNSALAKTGQETHPYPHPRHAAERQRKGLEEQEHDSA
jgi:hypothetical protein